MSVKNNNNFYYFLIVFVVILVFFGPRFSEQLPHCMLKLFLNPYFKVGIVFLAVFMIQYNIFLSIIVTLIFLIVMNKIENNVMFELFLSNTTDHFEDFDQVLEPKNNNMVNNEDDEDDEDDCIDDEYEGDTSYQGSKEMLKCMNGINDSFPCNNRTQDNTCCESPNYDIKIKNQKGEEENITLFMNKQLEKRNMDGIKKIHTWCKNYTAAQGPQANLKYGCSNNSLVQKCEKILGQCEFIKPPPKPLSYNFSGTCAAIDENIHNQVCFDLDPKQDKCKSFNKDQCIKNKKDCFYIENNQFINSKIRKNNAIYKCKIPKAEEPLPENCFPIKLYKDTCGNVGMGCWVKDKEIPIVQPPPKPHIPQPKIALFKKTPIIQKKLPTINYRTPNQTGGINNNICLN